MKSQREINNAGKSPVSQQDRMKGLCVGLILCVMGVAAAEQCVLDDSVTPGDRDKQEAYLHTLDSLIGKEWVTTRRNSEYHFVLCGDVVKKPPNATMIQKVKDAGEVKETLVLGLHNRTLVNSDKHWLMLTFRGGDPYTGNQCVNSSSEGRRQAHVIFICDHEEKEEVMTVLDDSEGTLACALTFIIRHRVVCTLSDPGLGGWSIFFIILLVSFGGYFIFGFFYLRLVKGAKGVEQIPNRTFWFRIGNMLADGCGAVFRCDRYCGVGNEGVVRTSSSSGSYSGYSPIEEQLAQDLQEADRDSTLLSP